jgi:hypothetical protein
MESIEIPSGKGSLTAHNFLTGLLVCITTLSMPLDHLHLIAVIQTNDDTMGPDPANYWDERNWILEKV